MAKKLEVLLVDDLDGSAADETIGFALDGLSYEIDLSQQNADTLREALGTYVNAARRVSTGRSTSRGRRGRSVRRGRSRAGPRAD